jgi:hypothetical protein
MVGGMEMNIFETLNKINVNGHTEQKNGLTYLSWAWAWGEFKKAFPDAVYEVVKFDGKPYVYDENLGYMCYTAVTVGGLTHEMWLPVMDNTNKTMKAEPYTYKDRYGKEKTVQAATMFDINKTIMRCLVKNLAMFGLGLYIYAGEDLPEEEQKEEGEKKKEQKRVVEDKVHIDALHNLMLKKGVTEGGVKKEYGVISDNLSDEQYFDFIRRLDKMPDKIEDK